MAGDSHLYKSTGFTVETIVNPEPTDAGGAIYDSNPSSEPTVPSPWGPSPEFQTSPYTVSGTSGSPTPDGPTGDGGGQSTPLAQDLTLVPCGDGKYALWTTTNESGQNVPDKQVGPCI